MSSIATDYSLLGGLPLAALPPVLDSSVPVLSQEEQQLFRLAGGDRDEYSELTRKLFGANSEQKTRTEVFNELRKRVFAESDITKRVAKVKLALDLLFKSPLTMNPSEFNRRGSFHIMMLGELLAVMSLNFGEYAREMKTVFEQSKLFMGDGKQYPFRQYFQGWIIDPVGENSTIGEIEKRSLIAAVAQLGLVS